jgi:hypothetical protein
LKEHDASFAAVILLTLLADFIYTNFSVNPQVTVQFGTISDDQSLQSERFCIQVQHYIRHSKQYTQDGSQQTASLILPVKQWLWLFEWSLLSCLQAWLAG